MRRTTTRQLVLILGLLLCVGLAQPHAQDAAKGAALMAEARKAVGGEDKLRSVKTLEVKGDFKRSAGQNNLEGELRIRLEAPGKLRRDEDITLPGGGPAISRTEVLNGTAVWEENSGPIGIGVGGRFGGGGFVRRGGGSAPDSQGGAQSDLDPAQMAQQLEEAQRRARQADLARLMLAWLLDAGGPVNWIGTAESPDGKADVLEITRPNAPAIRLFLDQSSHLPLMITWQGAAQMLFVRGGRPPSPLRGSGAPSRGGGRGPGDGQRAAGDPAQATLRMTLGEYKTVDGIKLPHFITRGLNGQTIEEWTIDSYRLNPAFRTDVFAK